MPKRNSASKDAVFRVIAELLARAQSKRETRMTTILNPTAEKGGSVMTWRDIAEQIIGKVHASLPAMRT